MDSDSNEKIVQLEHKIRRMEKNMYLLKDVLKKLQKQMDQLKSQH